MLHELKTYLLEDGLLNVPLLHNNLFLLQNANYKFNLVVKLILGFNLY